MRLLKILLYVADEEESKVAIIAEEVSKKQKDCEADLMKAEPALLAAQEALNTLNKANLTELKSFGSPPGAVTNVTAAVMVLLAPAGKVPKDRSWKAAKVASSNPERFKRITKRLIHFTDIDKRTIFSYVFYKDHDGESGHFPRFFDQLRQGEYTSRGDQSDTAVSEGL
jgi:hypothetical protein